MNPNDIQLILGHIETLREEFRDRIDDTRHRLQRIEDNQAKHATDYAALSTRVDHLEEAHTASTESRRFSITAWILAATALFGLGVIVATLVGPILHPADAATIAHAGAHIPVTK